MVIIKGHGLGKFEKQCIVGGPLEAIANAGWIVEVVRVNIHLEEPVAFYLDSWERHRRALRKREVYCCMQSTAADVLVW